MQIFYMTSSVIEVIGYMTARVFFCLYLAILFAGGCFASDLPECLSLAGSANAESVIANRPIEDRELLARLVYAEGLSTGYGDDPAVYRAIAWGVMNRVRLGERSRSMQRTYGRGIHGVIFKKGQFNPAVSPRSPFSREFLCPRREAPWRMAAGAARIAIEDNANPFIQTPWERAHGLSLVVNFYYPKSVQAKSATAPWESNRSLKFIGDIQSESLALSADRIRFYRLLQTPGDLKDQSTIQIRHEAVHSWMR